jgi:hypothetical protein
MTLQLTFFFGGEFAQNVGALELLEGINKAILIHARHPLQQDSLELGAVA